MSHFNFLATHEGGLFLNDKRALKNQGSDDLRLTGLEPATLCLEGSFIDFVVKSPFSLLFGEFNSKSLF